MYVDDIVITGDDRDGIAGLKHHLVQHFQVKDLGRLRYFLGIEVAQSKAGVSISQRKYALDILEETGMLDCKLIDTHMHSNVKLLPDQGEIFSDPGRYRRLVGKLNYLTMTRPDISYAVSVVSQFLNSPCDIHWDVWLEFYDISREPLEKVLFMQTEVIQILLHIQTQIGLEVRLTEGPHLDIVSSLEAI